MEFVLPALFKFIGISFLDFLGSQTVTFAGVLQLARLARIARYYFIKQFQLFNGIDVLVKVFGRLSCSM
jgi:hypothetical protein